MVDFYADYYGLHTRLGVFCVKTDLAGKQAATPGHAEQKFLEKSKSDGSLRGVGVLGNVFDMHVVMYVRARVGGQERANLVHNARHSDMEIKVKILALHQASLSTSVP